MEASVFVRQINAAEYKKLAGIKFSALPRIDEFVSAVSEGSKKYFQVVAIHHTSDGEIEIYAVQSEPSWEIRRSRTIGFGH